MTIEVVTSLLMYLDWHSNYDIWISGPLLGPHMDSEQKYLNRPLKSSITPLFQAEEAEFLSSSTFPCHLQSWSCPSHCDTSSEDTDRSAIDCYKVGFEPKGLTSSVWSLITTTIHCLAIDWHPSSSPTFPLVGYFTFTCRVKDTVPMAWSHGLARFVV